MNDFIKQNAWSLTLVIAGVVASYAVSGYRISRVEADVNELKGQMSVVAEVAVDVAVLRERTENQGEKIEEINENVKAIVNAFNVLKP